MNSSKPKPSLFVTHIEPEERTEPRPAPAGAPSSVGGRIEPVLRSGKVIDARLKDPDTDLDGSPVGYLIQYNPNEGVLDIRHTFGPFPTLVEAHIHWHGLEEASHYSIYEAFIVHPEAAMLGLTEGTSIDDVVAALGNFLDERTSLDACDYAYDLRSPTAALASFREWVLRNVITYRTGCSDLACEAVLELSTESLPLLREVTMDLEEFMGLVQDEDEDDPENARDAEILEILRKDYHDEE